MTLGYTFAGGRIEMVFLFMRVLYSRLEVGKKVPIKKKNCCVIANIHIGNAKVQYN